MPAVVCVPYPELIVAMNVSLQASIIVGANYGLYARAISADDKLGRSGVTDFAIKTTEHD